ncbi:Carboxypeptidase regulatory-like domain-containing protein [Pedobacter steynii]|uniref:Carboxypeptidase regulatory-like domain-containing protein n=1 Tax=Pedobacter steynii TaxID=430522 RepID=A0A1H0JRH5_9SPHI|nr:TonB-dependent receptor [Pedobacter steynii]NQX43138.1 TonB-dependent receptor [Pedobacter steynii]SDO46102.1 Carboxypeptidase regulatory-like domain-containing protein [Pedobacter steynii]
MKNSFWWVGLVLFFFLLDFMPSHAQVSIRGKVTSNGRPIGGVRVDLRRDSTSLFLAYTFTDSEGQYQLRTEHTGKMALHLKALGYEPTVREIELGQADMKIDVALVAGGVERLQEIVIHAKRPYKLSRDTIELNVQSYLQGEERTVEDLLRKIPGLNVGEDGSIKVGDKEVEKVMIEGDDFFEKGYRLLTQNMSVKPLDKVQVLQRYSNNKHLKGIENSDKVALNLQLKEDSKSQWLGSVSASGTLTKPMFYQGNVSLMNFGKKNKYYLLGSANNNGVDAVSSINNLLYSGQADEPGQIGAGVNTPTLIDYTPDLPGFDYKRTNFNRDRLLSFNTILNPTKQLKVKWLGFVNPTKKTFYQNRVQQYNIADIQFTNTEVDELNKRIDNYFSKWELQYDIGKRSTLSYNGSIGSLEKQDTHNLLFNGSSTKELTRTKGYLTNHNLSYTYKLSDREALVSSARWIKQGSPLDYSIDRYYYEDLFQVGGISEVSQHVENNLQYLGFTSHYVRKQKGGDFMEVAFVNEYKDQELTTDFVLQADDKTGIHPSGFSNQVGLVTNNTSIISKYTMKRRKWEWTPQFHAGFVHSGFRTYGAIRNRNNWLLSPRLSTKWEIHSKGKLEAEFSLKQTNTELMDVIPNYYSTGIRQFVKGLDDMATLTSSGALLTYTHGNMLDRFFANLSVGYQTMFDYISSQSMINPNFNLAAQVLLKNKKRTFYKTQLNYYLKPVNGNFKLDIGADFSDYQANVVGVGERKIHTGSLDYGLSFRSVWKSRFNLHTGYRMQMTTFSSERKNRLKNTYGFLNMFVNVTKGIQANLNNEAYRFGDFFAETSKTYYFSDFSLSYDAKKIKTRFEISAKNIFNTRQFKNAVITETYQAVTEYRLLPRYVALGVDYSF